MLIKSIINIKCPYSKQNSFIAQNDTLITVKLKRSIFIVRPQSSESWERNIILSEQNSNLNARNTTELE